MRNFIICLILIIIFPGSCISGGNNIIPESVFENAEHLSASDTIFRISHETPPYAVYVYGDSLMVMWMHNSAEYGHIYSFYNFDDPAHPTPYLAYGASDDKFLSGLLFRHRDTLVSFDVIKQRIAVTDVGLAAANPCYYTPEIKNINFSSQFFIPFRNGLLCLNPDCFPEAEQEFRKDGPRFYTVDSTFVSQPVSEYNSNTVNVVAGIFDINWEKGRIIYADNDINHIEVYDTDFRHLKTLTGFTKYPPKYAFFEIDGIRTFAYHGHVSETYKDMATTADFVYCCFLNTVSKEDKDREDLKSYILKLDWDGNIAASYSIDMYAKTISVSKDNKNLYVYGLDSDGNSVVRYSLQ